MKHCDFCGDNRIDFLINNNYDVKTMYFYEDDDFSISTDLSPLMVGHLLVIPHQHYTCLGEITNKEIFDKIKQKSEMLLGQKDLLYFEHGSVLEGKGGASVDHAHLHVMPRPVELDVAKIDEYIRNSNYITKSKLSADYNVLNSLFRQKQPYIYYEILGQKFAYPVDAIPHQFFRRMLQPYGNLSYNWRETYQTDECRKNVDKTITFVNENRKDR